nr:hypothetical protein [Chlorobium phaeovibrioides]
MDSPRVQQFLLGGIPETVVRCCRFKFLWGVESLPRVKGMLFQTLTGPSWKPLVGIVLLLMCAVIVRQFPPDNQLLKKGSFRLFRGTAALNFKGNLRCAELTKMQVGGEK